MHEGLRRIRKLGAVGGLMLAAGIFALVVTRPNQTFGLPGMIAVSVAFGLVVAVPLWIITWLIDGFMRRK
jgi:hypothetical protein